MFGYYRTDFQLNQNCVATHVADNQNDPLPFIAKLDENETCLWLNTLNGTNIPIGLNNPTAKFASIEIDSKENLYAIFGLVSQGPTIVDFGNDSISVGSGFSVYLTKISSSGNWDWTEKASGGMYCPCSLQVDSNDSPIISYSSGNSNAMSISKFNSSGSLISSYGPVGGTGNQVIKVYDSVIDSNNNFYAVGSYANSANFPGAGTFYCSSCWSAFIVKFDSNLSISWVKESKSSTQNSYAMAISLFNDDEIFVVGDHYSEMTFNGTTINSGSNHNSFVAKMNSSGDWQWGIPIECSCSTYVYDIDLDSNGNSYVTGAHYGTLNLGSNLILTPAGGSADGFIAKFNYSGNSEWAKSVGGPVDDQLYSASVNHYSGDLFVAGYFANTVDFGKFTSTSVGSTDGLLAKLSSDYDEDDITDNNDNDDDGDFIQDVVDLCQFSTIVFISTVSIDHDSDGCHDETEDNDDDNDQLNDTLDNCPKGMTGWIRTNASDLDDDGCMDALEDYDDDNDGFEDYEDYCSRIPGNSTFEFEKGCPDADGDGRPDILDPFKDDPTEWSDTDGDEVGDNADAFPSDATQQYDTDGDTYGDEEFGNAGDSCPTVFGTSTIDRYGCIDTDGDGWSDQGDDFPFDPTEYLDTDGDEIPDDDDAFPYDPTQQTDSDGDGYGDNKDGNLGDQFQMMTQLNLRILIVME